MTDANPPNPCAAYCLAERFDFTRLSRDLLQSSRAQLFVDALVLDHKDAWSMIFAYGAVVHWNVNRDGQAKVHEILRRYAERLLTRVEEDNFMYDDGHDRERIYQDRIELRSAEPLVLLALSHAIAQSVKLSSFESSALETIESTRHLPQSLAQEGKIRLRRAETAKIRGQLFLAKADIILRYDLLDTPEFFWEYPEYQPIYDLAARYLELRQRTDVLSKKLETIHELLEMLADEQKHQHSSTLEWIIIWLIFVEIVISLVEKAL